MDESSNKFRFLIPLLSGLFAVIFLLCGVIYIIFNINIFKVDNIQNANCWWCRYNIRPS